MMEFVAGLILGAIVTFVVREYLLTRDKLRQNESQREAFELEQRIWKNVKEKLDREKEIRK